MTPGNGETAVQVEEGEVRHPFPDPSASYDEWQRAQAALPWEVKIKPAGRWSWWVTCSKGMWSLGGFGGFHALGSRARAERIARRKIDRIERKEAREAALTVEVVIPSRVVSGSIARGGET